MNDDEQLLARVRGRAHDPDTRIDESKLGSPRLASPASPSLLASVEQRLGHALHPLHRRLLGEIANGAFGPGYGMIGVGGGHLDEGRSALELAEELGLPSAVLPFCDLGCGAWSCVDATSGAILVHDEAGLTDTGRTIDDWLADWVEGVDVVSSMFGTLQREIQNPFTHESMTIRLRDRAIGAPYSRTA